jgi:ATP-GRASP peptide maturase of grasp-with-spasm system
MILIISDESDGSTNEVINWLLYLKIPYYRINETCSIHVDFVKTTNDTIDYKLTITNPHIVTPFSIFSSEIKGFWYRRGFFILQMGSIPLFYSSELNIVAEKFNKYISEENVKIVDFFHKYFSNIPHLGYFQENFTTNKIYELSEAQNMKILIPNFLITRYKTDVELFVSKHIFCITKGLCKNGFRVNNNIGLGNMTKMITAPDLILIPPQFNYSFFQQYIDKKADIRIFYIAGKIYSTAIFSQNDEKTKIDFRNYNEEKPNRIVPFNLPSDEEKKLRKLMNKLNYNTASIDYLLDKNNNLFFLEINPVGQYGFISRKCNLFLDKIICNFFKSNLYVRK